MTIILLHGLFGSLSEPKITGAFEEAPVLAPDLLGYGENQQMADGWTLADQADHVAGWLGRRNVSGPVDVVGHSVGGAVAVLFAARHPRLIRSLTSVEGNFTLRDAFWSQKISTQDLPQIEAEVAGFRADVAGWIGRAGVAPTPWRVATATTWLAHQPASTLRAQARAVVEATKGQAFLDTVRELLASGLRLHLLASERGRGGWSVPDWVVAGAASNAEMAGVGHLMMLEDPQAFARAVVEPIRGAV